MRTAAAGVVARATEHLGDEGGDMVGVMRVHAGEDRPEDRVGRNLGVEQRGEVAERIDATCPFGESRYGVRAAHPAPAIRLSSA